MQILKINPMGLLPFKARERFAGKIVSIPEAEWRRPGRCRIL
jgi:hypothetical protein